MKLDHLIFVAMLVQSLPAAAQTTVTPIDPTGPYIATIDQPSGAVFTDQFSFDLPVPLLVSSSVDLSREWGTFHGTYFASIDATNVGVQLFQSSNTIIGDGDDVLVQPFLEVKNEFPTGPGVFFQGSHLFELPNTALVAGPHYYVQVSGIAAAQNGARYAITVPEPSRLLLLIAGSIALACFERRRACGSSMAEALGAPPSGVSCCIAKPQAP